MACVACFVLMELIFFKYLFMDVFFLFLCQSSFSFIALSWSSSFSSNWSSSSIKTFIRDTFWQKHGRCPSVQSFFLLFFKSKNVALSFFSISFTKWFSSVQISKKKWKEMNKHCLPYGTKNTLSQSYIKEKGEKETFPCWIGSFCKLYFYSNELRKKNRRCHTKLWKGGVRRRIDG